MDLTFSSLATARAGWYIVNTGMHSHTGMEFYNTVYNNIFLYNAELNEKFYKLGYFTVHLSYFS